MQGIERPAGFLSVDVIAPGLVDKDTIFGLLAAYRDKIFPPELVDGLFAPRSKAGQPSIPGAVMCAALVLQAVFGLSDRQMVEVLTYDLRYKQACGFDVDQRPFHQTTLVYARKPESTDPVLWLVFPDFR